MDDGGMPERPIREPPQKRLAAPPGAGNAVDSSG
jgi:hypothetical protein